MKNYDDENVNRAVFAKRMEKAANLNPLFVPFLNYALANLQQPE
jgi:hypothetical protein